MTQVLDALSIDVRSLRDRIGWTQEQVAQYLVVDRSMISRMEGGGPISGPVRRLLLILASAAERGTADTLLDASIADALVITEAERSEPAQ